MFIELYALSLDPGDLIKICGPAPAYTTVEYLGVYVSKDANYHYFLNDGVVFFCHSGMLGKIIAKMSETYA